MIREIAAASVIACTATRIAPVEATMEARWDMGSTWHEQWCYWDRGVRHDCYITVTNKTYWPIYTRQEIK